MDLALIVVIQVLYAVAGLVIVSAGLAVIFGRMKVINLAHGEFMMLGAYATITAHGLGLNLWLAMLVVAPIVVGLIGVVLERLVIRRLYGRMVDTMLATWGLSLLLVGIVTSIAGNTTAGVSAPLGSFSIGAYSVSAYTLVIIGVAVVLAVAVAAPAVLSARASVRRTLPPCEKSMGGTSAWYACIARSLPVTVA